METATETMLACPECALEGNNNSFATPQALGAHRNRKHGVAGKNKRPNRRNVPPAEASQMKRNGNGNDNGHSLDRNKLLGLVFPQGIPAKADLIGEIDGWLQEADRLARAK